MNLDILMTRPMSSANANRGELGRPKRSVQGGVARTRVSSPSCKKPFREKMMSLLDEEPAVRSREAVARKIVAPLEEEYGEIPSVLTGYAILKGMDIDGTGGPKAKVKGYLSGKKSRKDMTETGQMVVFGVAELAYLRKVAEDIVTQVVEALKEMPEDWERGESPPEDALNSIVKAVKSISTGDLGKNMRALAYNCAETNLLGRMSTSDALSQIETPMMMASGWTVHERLEQADISTAIDTLREKDSGGHSGAGHMRPEFLADGLIAQAAGIDVPLLKRNCGGDIDAVVAILRAALKSLPAAFPDGHKSSTYPAMFPNLVVCSIQESGAHNLQQAFIEPVGQPYYEKSIDRLVDRIGQWESMWGPVADRMFVSGLDYAEKIVDEIDMAEGLMSIQDICDEIEDYIRKEE